MYCPYSLIWSNLSLVSCWWTRPHKAVNISHTFIVPVKTEMLQINVFHRTATLLQGYTKVKVWWKILSATSNSMWSEKCVWLCLCVHVYLWLCVHNEGRMLITAWRKQGLCINNTAQWDFHFPLDWLWIGKASFGHRCWELTSHPKAQSTVGRRIPVNISSLSQMILQFNVFGRIGVNPGVHWMRLEPCVGGSTLHHRGRETHRQQREADEKQNLGTCYWDTG